VHNEALPVAAVRAEEKLTGFMELESTTRAALVPGDLAAPCNKETRSFQFDYEDGAPGTILRLNAD
jgi:hypothetical protein